MHLVRKSLLICLALIEYAAGVANAEATLLSQTSFSDAVPGGWADSVVVQSDGKIIAGGVSHSPVFAPVLVRFNVDGSLDESFGLHGRVIECGQAVSTAMALLPDGRILLANGRGSTVPLHLYRFLPDGSRDPSFGSGGMVSGPSGRITSLALQPDGKIVLAGARNNDVLVVRLLADGSPDPAFGNAGIVTTSVTALPDRAEAISLQPDDTIAIATQQFAVVRFLQDGSLDPSFGASGIASIDTSGLSASSSDLAIQPDGGIVVVGQISNRFGLVRYTALGTVDTDFGNAGVLVGQFGSGRSEAHAVALTANGIVVGGQADATVNSEPVTGFALARYLDDGTLDSNFADDGVALTISNGYATILALSLSGDDIVAAGNLDLREDLYTYYSNSELAVLRYGSNGVPDSTFDGDGIASAAVGPADNVFPAIAVQEDGKFVVAGTADLSNEDYRFDSGLARFNADGTLDDLFGSHGRVIQDVPYFGTPAYWAYAVAIQPDGKIVSAGQASGAVCAYVRFQPDGSLDTTFGNAGILADESLPYGCSVEALEVQQDGKIVATGYSGSGSAFLKRYNSDGTADASFGTNGSVFTNFGGSNASATALALQPDGKPVIAGIASGNFALARFTTDGALDTDFGSSGTVTTDLGTAQDIALAVAVQDDGKIVATGASSGFTLVRYNGNGSIDASFGIDGVVKTVISSTSDRSHSIVVLPDDHIVVAGAAGTNLAFARYRPDGSLDVSFAGTGTWISSIEDSHKRGRVLAMEADGSVLGAGTIARCATAAGDIAVVRISFPCGNGTLEDDEECDLGSEANGGTSVCCASDCRFVASGQECRPGSGDICDAPELCTGSSAECPSDDASLNGGQPCRTGSGDVCDADEVCTGIPGEPCPPDDAPGKSGFLCRVGSGDSCDTDESCTGVAGATCPADDAPANAGVVCRSGSGDSCDESEVCSGVPDAPCPPDDAPTRFGVICREGSGDACDPDETCTGVPGATCPTDVVAAAGTVCRADAGPCDVPEVCSGSTGTACPDDSLEPDGTSCSDGLYCNGPETCSSGICEAGQGPCAYSCNESTATCIGCPVAPAEDCLSAAQDMLKIRTGDESKRNRILWRWTRGSSIEQAELADPSATATYSLCLYQGSEPSLAAQLMAFPDGELWKPIGRHQDGGYLYRDRAGMSFGISNVQVRTSDSDRSRAGVTGKGSTLPDLPLPLELPVTVQLFNSDTGLCLSSDLPSASHNEATRFQARRR